MRLISGATGLVGSYVCCELLKQGHKVRAIKRKNAQTDWFYNIARDLGIATEKLTENLEWREVELYDTIGLEEAMQGVERVYHCAALVSFSPKDREALYKVNVEGTAAIVNAAIAAKVKKVIYISSIAALSRKTETEPIDETSEWEESPRNSHYAKSKYFGELELWRGQEEGLDVVILNPAFVLGFGNPNKSSTGIIQKVRRGFLFYTEGVNGYVYVKDVAKATVMVGESETSGERFVLSAWNLSYKELFFTIAHSFGRPTPRILISKKAGLFFMRILQFLSKWKFPLHFITPETIRTAISTYNYSSEKIKRTFNFEFTPLNTCMSEISSSFIRNETDTKASNSTK